MSFVGKQFPNIEVNAMSDLGDTFKINVLSEAVNSKKKVLLFWYPKDFTFVCPTELHASKSISRVRKTQRKSNRCLLRHCRSTLRVAQHP